MHFSAFHPDYKMTDRGATPIALLEKICARAKEFGLRFPYLGNVAHHPYENTYARPAVHCSSRGGDFRAGLPDSTTGSAPDCGETIEIVRHVT